VKSIALNIGTENINCGISCMGEYGILKTNVSNAYLACIRKASSEI